MSTIETYVNLRGVNMLKDALKILSLTTVKTMYFVAKTFGMQFYVVTYCKLVVKSKGSII